MKLLAGALLSAAMVVALAAPAYALKIPRSCGHDTRIRCADYDPGEIWEIWTAPGAIFEIQFPPDESVPEGNVAATDGSRLERKPRGNYLYLKVKGCLDPEPLLVTTKLPSGELRSYKFQLESRGSDCSEPVAQTQPLLSMASTADGVKRPHQGNLKYVAENGLAAGADVMYAVQFTDRSAEAAKRRAAAQVRYAAAQHKQAQDLLKQQTTWPYGNPYDGTWNFKYAAHGNLIPPSGIRDNGYQTVFQFPYMQRVPALFRGRVGAWCNREHDDHNESTETPSVHKSTADGDTIIASGTAPVWCLRDGSNVLEVLNLGFDQQGKTPGTGTVSPNVQRVLKGDFNEEH